MRPKLLFLIFIFILLCVVGIVVAQENLCEAHEAELSEIVATVCSTIGNNEVCYGNFTVNLVPLANSPEPNFSVPGDTADLGGVQSLFLSELNLADGTWGIAQIHLLAVSPRGTQDVMLLLFGDVRVDNEVENTARLSVEALTSTNIRNSPTINGVVIGSVGAGEAVEALGRLEDSSWVRVQVPETGAIGWILSQYVVPVDATESLVTLDVQKSNQPYFGAMQAMSLTTGSGSACSNLETNGLLIQTPAGTARVTFLINEVTIELVPSTQRGATAFIQSNPEDGMSVTMIDGSAFVSSEDGGFFVPTGATTNITLDNTSKPITPPSIPITLDPKMGDTIELMGAIGNGSVPVITIVIPPASTNIGTNTSSTSASTNTNTSTTSTGTDESSSTDTDETDESTETDDTDNSGETDDTDNTNTTEEETCTGPGSSCDAPGHQTGDDCTLGGNACDAASRTDRP